MSSVVGEMDVRWVQEMEPVELVGHINRGIILNCISDILDMKTPPYTPCILGVERRGMSLDISGTWYKEVVIRYGFIIPGELGELAESGKALALNTS